VAINKKLAFDQLGNIMKDLHKKGQVL